MAAIDATHLVSVEVRESGPSVELVAESEVIRRLRASFANNEYVCVELAPFVLGGVVAVRVHEYSFDDRFVRRRANAVWQCMLFSDAIWEATEGLLVERADWLLDSKDWLAVEDPRETVTPDFLPRWTALVYHTPREHVVKIRLTRLTC